MTDETTARGPALRAYLTAPGKISYRRSGAEIATDDLSQMTAAELLPWACEGRISVYGKTLPDRTPPREKVAATKEREPTNLQKAIAAVRVAELTKAARAAGERPNKDEIAAWLVEATAKAKAMDVVTLKIAQKREAVQIELARLRGEHGGVGDLFKSPDPELTEAVAAELSEAAE